VTDPAVKRARGGGNGTVFEITLGAADALLMTAVRGAHLVARSKCQPPESIVEMLAAALRACHSVNASDCPIEAYVPSESIVRGDACLPNIVVGEDGSNGYIDLADMGPATSGSTSRPRSAACSTTSARGSAALSGDHALR
jgi:aminoglycoside phosphotransferase